ncbi:ComEA family DNA-binding protein [Bacteroides sp.]
MWKDFFYFTRAERQGIILLAALIALAFTACWLIPPKETKATNDHGQFEEDYNNFIASIKEKERHRKEHHSNQHYQREVILAPFDPNTADSATFLQLGLPAWMAKNILRYRTKGGKFHTPEDFKKVYGLTEEQYAPLLPYIRIREQFGKRDTIRLLAREDMPAKTPVYKYPAGTVVDLNRADTTELKKIPGIGSGIARMIVGYRSRLGGFYSVEQLQDIHIITRELKDWLVADEAPIQRLNLNRASVERLKAHPYINFYQAKVIVEYRKKKRELKSLKQISLYEEFTPQDLERISHYVCFE